MAVICDPELDSRNLLEHLIPKVMAAKGQYDVHFHPKHVGVEVTPLTKEDEVLPQGAEPYYLRANTGPRWLLGGVLSRPFITTAQSEGKFAISSIESSDAYDEENNPFARRVVFEKTHHCFVVVEGKAELSVGEFAPTIVTEGETVFVGKGPNLW